MLRKPNGFFDAIRLGEHILVIISVFSPTSNEKDAKECEKTATNKLGSLLLIRLFEIAVQHCAADDDTQCEHDELNGDDLRRVEARQSLVDIANLHNGSRQ